MIAWSFDGEVNGELGENTNSDRMHRGGHPRSCMHLTELKPETDYIYIHK